MQSVVSCYCNQLMVDIGSVCGRYYKPVVMICCCTAVQQCPVGQEEQDELVIATSYAITLAVHCHQRLGNILDISKPKQNQFSFPGSSTKRDQQSSGSDISSKETGKDDHIQQCKQVGQDELVIAASSYSWYNHDYIHTIVCRYCREEVNSCYYKDHLVNCLESNKCGQGECLVVDKMVQVTSSSDNGFVVNCVAVQESFHR